MSSHLCKFGFLVIYSVFSTYAGDVEDTTKAAVSYPDSDMSPDFVIFSEDAPCLLATINVSIKITYKAQSGMLNEVYNKEVTLPMDDEAVVNGSCEGNFTYLSLTWWDGMLALNLTFVEQIEQTDISTIKGFWWASEINLFYDTSNNTIFPEAIKGGPKTVTKKDLVLFKSPVGMAFLCDAQERLTVGGKGKMAVLHFSHVHIQPFGVQTDKFAEDNECNEDVEIVLERKDAYIVPIIVACCLTAICVILVIGYAISRRLNKFKAQSSYKPMD